MTKKDYKLIADALASVESQYLNSAVVTALCQALSRDNPRFDTQKFIKRAYGL